MRGWKWEIWGRKKINKKEKKVFFNSQKRNTHLACTHMILAGWKAVHCNESKRQIVIFFWLHLLLFALIFFLFSFLLQVFLLSFLPFHSFYLLKKRHLFNVWLPLSKTAELTHNISITVQYTKKKRTREVVYLRFIYLFILYQQDYLVLPDIACSF